MPLYPPRQHFCLQILDNSLTLSKTYITIHLGSEIDHVEEGLSPRRASRAKGAWKKEGPRSRGKSGKRGPQSASVFGARLTVGRPNLPWRKCRSESDAPNHRTSGPTLLEATPVRITAPGRNPEAMTTLSNIADSTLFFQSRGSGFVHNMSDGTRHECPFSRSENHDYRRPD